MKKQLLFYVFVLMINFLLGVVVAGQFPAIIPIASAAFNAINAGIFLSILIYINLLIIDYCNNHFKRKGEDE